MTEQFQAVLCGKYIFVESQLREWKVYGSKLAEGLFVHQKVEGLVKGQ